MRRGCVDDYVNTRVYNIFVCVKPDETVLIGYVDITLLLEGPPAIVKTVLENIPECRNLNIGPGIEKIYRCPGSPSAASYQSSFQQRSVRSFIRKNREFIFFSSWRAG